VNRFDQVVICPGVQSAGNAPRRTEGREDQDRDVRSLADFLADFPSIHTRHEKVEDKHIGRRGLAGPDALFTRQECLDLEVLPPKEHAEHHGEHRVIIDQQNPPDSPYRRLAVTHEWPRRPQVGEDPSSQAGRTPAAAST